MNYAAITVKQFKEEKNHQLQAILATGKSYQSHLSKIGRCAGNKLLTEVSYALYNDNGLDPESYTIGAIKDLLEMSEIICEGFARLTINQVYKKISKEKNDLFVSCFNSCAENEYSWLNALKRYDVIKLLKTIIDICKNTELENSNELKEWLNQNLDSRDINLSDVLGIGHEDEYEIDELIKLSDELDEPRLGLSVPTGSIKPLFDHQKDAFNAVCNFVKKLKTTDTGPFAQIVQPTGSGKTRVGNEIVLHCFDGNSQSSIQDKILWIAPSWILLKQAHDALLDLSPSMRQKIGRIGGANELLKNLPENTKCNLFYTTIITLANRIKNQTLNLKIKLIIFDECHWGLNASSFPTIYHYAQHAHPKIPIIGLTATPKTFNNQAPNIIFSKSYKELLEVGILAQPIVHTTNTGYTWTPQMRNGLLIQSSLDQLNTVDRNKIILDKLKDVILKKKQARILVFACSIKHADDLAQLFSLNNISCRSVHSAMQRNISTNIVDDFRQGKIGVLINVLQLTHGFDVPEIDTIFLARPTESDVLCAQMVGRGSRRLAKKTSFEIYDFHDNLAGSVANKIFLNVNSLFQGAANRAQDPVARRIPVQHEAPDHPYFEILVGDEFSNIQGISYVCNQTFGIEIELTKIGSSVPNYNTPAWNKVAQEIIEIISDAIGIENVYQIPSSYHGTPSQIKANQWHLEHDGSVGWELISPILKGRNGFTQIVSVCQALEVYTTHNQNNIGINKKTGLHVTLATRLESESQMMGFMQRVQRLEPGLYTLVAPSRLNNSYCRPVRGFDLNEISNQMQSLHRYRGVNIIKWANQDPYLVEVRMHNGTVDASKIIPWICLWMKIFNVSAYQWTGHGVNGDIFPGNNTIPSGYNAQTEDIFYLLENENINISQKLKCILHERRKTLSFYWRNRFNIRTAEWGNAGWYLPRQQCHAQSSIAVEVLAPSLCQNEAIDTFLSMVSSGGEVDTQDLEKRVMDARVLAFAYYDDEVAGVGALKKPKQNYAKRVFSNAGTQERSGDYPLELGWIYVKPAYRGRKIATMIVSDLLEYRNGESVFLTATTNGHIIRVIVRHGFQSSGNSYLSSIDPNKQIQLYVKK